MGGLDPIGLQVMLGALASICEEMGAVLIRSAHSANIKERRDCSTALFDATGEMVSQAEHIPVHLGSMPEAVAAIVAHEQIPGRSWIGNDPFAGGTHLPDVTVITPVFGANGLLGFVAARAHHADIGGPTAGGMPANSRSLTDEGVVIAPQPIGPKTLDELAAAMRNPLERLADFRAQAAANRIGVIRLEELADRLGSEAVAAAMSSVLDYAERRCRGRLDALKQFRSSAVDYLEAADGSDVELRVAAELNHDTLRFDFSGSAPQLDGNLNCPLTVTRSATLFAVRALLDPDAPPSAGGHRPIEVSAPSGSILNARPGAAVAAGNVETSSRVADLVIEALAAAIPAPAQGQGTMNNLTLTCEQPGSAFTYYETLGGGQGGAADGPGPSAIHVAMSNTLNTPIEALELEFPLRVRELALRRGSGGAGAMVGGEGMVREIEALAPIEFNLITERRRRAPRGRFGGGNGATGRNLKNGIELPAKCAGKLEPGDRLRIETPGGGGYGEPPVGRKADGD